MLETGALFGCFWVAFTKESPKNRTQESIVLGKETEISNGSMYLKNETK